MSRILSGMFLVGGSNRPRKTRRTNRENSSKHRENPGNIGKVKIRVPQKECGKRSSITFFGFRDAFGHFSVTFSDASVTFFVTFLPNSLCRTPFAAG